MWCPSCRGLGCSECRPASSLSALVAFAAELASRQVEFDGPCPGFADYEDYPPTAKVEAPAIKAPIYFGHQRSDSEWKREQFGDGAIQ